jgi:hypothetical protein
MDTLDFAGNVLFILLITLSAVALIVAWLKVLISIARSSISSVSRTLLFGVVLFTGPFVGTAIGWLALRSYRSRSRVLR